MPKRTPTDIVRDVPAGAKSGQRRRLLEPAPRQLRSTERALAAREQQVADAERALAAREQKTADTTHALSTSEQQKADAKRALERVQMWLPAVAKSEAPARDCETTPASMMPCPPARVELPVPGKEKSKNKISVNIKKAGTETMFFITSTHRTLEKLMCRYCEIQSLDVSSTKFFLELHSGDTGDTARLHDGSVLHVLTGA